MAEKKSKKNAPTAQISGEAGAFRIAQDPVLHEPTEGDPHKFEIASEPTDSRGSQAPPVFEDLGELPASYYDDTLFLVARDPRWLFCYWDFDSSRYSGAAMRGGVPQFFLKIETAAGVEESLVEIKPEARNWYVPVSLPGEEYVAELGYFDRSGTWKRIVQSGVASTPADGLAADSAADFATVPVHLTFERLLELVREKMLEGESLIAALSRISGEGRLEFRAGGTPTWTDEQKRLLAALLGDSLVDRVGLGSAEIDQLLRKALHEKLHSESASGLSGGLLEKLGPSTSSLFSGIGASWSAQPFSVLRERGFYMHVNAEIIFYGGTHPDATVTIQGKQIQLKPDGTFRYHFTLPDGDFSIPIVAQSPDEVEQRSATLSFQRETARVGDVASTGQPSELAPLPGRK